MDSGLPLFVLCLRCSVHISFFSGLCCTHTRTQTCTLKRTHTHARAKIHLRMGVSSYVMDFAYLPKRDTCVMIELSSFLPSTGKQYVVIYPLAESHREEIGRKGKDAEGKMTKKERERRRKIKKLSLPFSPLLLLSLSRAPLSFLSPFFFSL